MTNHEHEEEAYGLAIGFRIVEEEGKLYLAEAEIAPYVDEPDELGVTLVFHPLEGVDPVAVEEEDEWPSWPIDIDDDLEPARGASMEAQFGAIVRQLYGLSEERLRQYLGQAREEAENQA